MLGRPVLGFQSRPCTSRACSRRRRTGFYGGGSRAASNRCTEPSPEAAAQRESWDSDHTQSRSASEVGKEKIGARFDGGEVKDDEVATGDGDEDGGGGSGDGRRRRRMRRKKKQPPYIGEGPLVPAPINTRDEKTFSLGWYYEPGLKVYFGGPQKMQSTFSPGW